MGAPEGLNIRHFSPLVESQNVVREVVATATAYSSRISFNVPAQNKKVVETALSALGVLTHQWDMKSYGTRFDVVGVAEIKKSLDHLLEKKLITNEFYQNLVEKFPKAYGGDLNLSNTTIEVLNPLINRMALTIFNLLAATAREADKLFLKRVLLTSKPVLQRETLQLVEKDKKEKQQLEVRAKLAQQQAERLAFLNLKSQILGTSDSVEAELVRNAFRKKA